MKRYSYLSNIYDIINIADSLDKNIWMILGGGESCNPCNRIINDMNKNHLFEKYKDDFIFYKCNTRDKNNAFLQHIFLMTVIPNSYIINRDGNVVSFLQKLKERMVFNTVEFAELCSIMKSYDGELYRIRL